ncbi:DUF721 domain-containing protein [Parvibaculum sp.]|uniref:DUF721 domain-containing protein n=1 Tax=Parvibaculum sp. TaxID=2024848 RepID=UPI002CF4FACD|nr:DciA family protein [Parvibaculum sp.]HUD52763.1 DciA family protein [Parvibaculum sp.]
MTRYGRPIAPMRYQTPPIGARVPAITRDIFRKRGFSQSHILAHWPAIIGEALAEYCSPEKLAFPRTPNEGRGPQGSATLTVRVDGPIALEIRHLEPQIVERINGYYGYTAVARLKLVQGPLPPRPKSRRRKFRPLTQGERDALVRSLDPIGEPALKSALERLGQRILGTSARLPDSRARATQRFD